MNKEFDQGITIIKEIYKRIAEDEELLRYVAKATKRMYGALMDEGFIHEEAMQILISLCGKISAGFRKEM